MTHPPRFLQSILAVPQANLPRLRYANWLDGCGNPLGEFIRLQCAAPATPLLGHERREHQLLNEHQRHWTRLFADCVEWCSFRRGFVEEIALSDAQLLEHAPVLFRQAPIFDIHLTSDGKRLDDLGYRPELSHSVFLDLSSQPFGDDGVERLAEAPFLAQVHGLNLSSCFISDFGLDALGESPHLDGLRELYLNDNPITDEGIRRLALSPLLERLQDLHVTFTQIGPDSVALLRRVLGERCAFNTNPKR